MTLITLKDGKPVVKDGKVGTWSGCCCGCPCVFPLPAGMVPHVTAKVTFPSVPGDCTSGTYTVKFDMHLNSYSGCYEGCGQIAFNDYELFSVHCNLYCSGGTYQSQLNVYTSPCDFLYFTCTIGGGGFIGVGLGYNIDQPSSVVGGVCVPKNFETPVLHYPLDIDVQYSMTF